MGPVAGGATLEPGAASTLALPPVPSGFPQLRDQTPEALEQLLCDEAQYRQFVGGLDYVGELDAALAGYAAANVERARTNLDLVSQISDLRNQIAVIRSSEEPQVRQRFQALLERHDEVLRVLDPAALLQRLETAVAEVDNESSELSEAFCAGKVGTDEFVEAYLKQRTLYHQRDIKRQAVVRARVEEQERAARGLSRCDAFSGAPSFTGSG